MALRAINQLSRLLRSASSYRGAGCYMLDKRQLIALPVAFIVYVSESLAQQSVKVFEVGVCLRGGSDESGK
ncbi:hypothetical protein LMG22037_05480 [Paraburkholderia phenoliruptrix]|uniref:Uncharacterized protein n=1 Tax=Paraburkholderia phenoliruptrix TaxID=252970 RepID=A0A6J5C7Q6_9BURK|nr:hypothetical protein LMG22037_05480 [Paraburkholderia phenoliruptrix]